MDNDEHLKQLDARIAAIEAWIHNNASPQAKRAAAPVAPEPVTRAAPPPSAPPLTRKAFVSSAPSFPVTNLLGWAGATALVMASVYLVMLAIDAGWLTPLRQVMLAMLGGAMCIGAGLLLREKDMHYASLLPATGIVVLFLALYGAHNYYHLLGTTAAGAGIVAVCLLALWLNRMFMSEMYALFAVLGSYTAPLFLGDHSYSITDLILYFACWSVLFSVFALWVRERAVYMLAMYLALVIFDVMWSATMRDAWLEALVFQTVHFAIFVTAATLFSLRIENMSLRTAYAHIPALVLFYFVQYHILDTHVPAIAPWVAVGSAAVLLACYFIVYRVLMRDLSGGRILLSAYVALVLVHAVYVESVSAHWAPWVGLLVVPLLGGYAYVRGDAKAPGTPLWLAVMLIFSANYFTLLVGDALPHDNNVPAHQLLGLCYAAELYLGFHLLRDRVGMKELARIALYAGHIALMAWAMQLFDNRFLVSLSWGVLALGCLMLSLKFRDKILGQSSLLIFAASIFKAMLYDIALATPLIRIASLAVLGASLYLGGWLYKKVSALEER